MDRLALINSTEIRIRGGDSFQLATDSLTQDTERQLVAELKVQQPLSQKRLLVAVPSIDAIKSLYPMKNILLESTEEILKWNNLAESVHKQNAMIASIIDKIGIYTQVNVVETSGARMQPSSTETILYFYISPDRKSVQWYIDGTKSGVQTVNVDGGQPKFIGKIRSFINSVKGYALND